MNDTSNNFSGLRVTFQALNTRISTNLRVASGRVNVGTLAQRILVTNTETDCINFDLVH